MAKAKSADTVNPDPKIPPPPKKAASTKKSSKKKK